MFLEIYQTVITLSCLQEKYVNIDVFLGKGLEEADPLHEKFVQLCTLREWRHDIRIYFDLLIIKQALRFIH